MHAQDTPSKNIHVWLDERVRVREDDLLQYDGENVSFLLIHLLFILPRAGSHAPPGAHSGGPRLWPGTKAAVTALQPLFREPSNSYFMNPSYQCPTKPRATVQGSTEPLSHEHTN